MSSLSFNSSSLMGEWSFDLCESIACLWIINAFSLRFWSVKSTYVEFRARWLDILLMIYYYE